MVTGVVHGVGGGFSWGWVHPGVRHGTYGGGNKTGFNRVAEPSQLLNHIEKANMAHKKLHVLTAAAIAAMVAGTPAMTSCKSTHDSGASASSKHACKGLNACKGQGGCSSSDNGCKGKNSCKGKGGCNADKNSCKSNSCKSNSCKSNSCKSG